MKKRSLLLIVAGLLVFAAIFGAKFFEVRAAMAARAKMLPPPPTVSTATAKKDLWTLRLHAVATLQSAQGIVVSNEVAGVVKTLGFDSGQVVQAGTPLLVLDDSTEQAQFEGLKAGLKLAAINLARAEDLRAKGTNTPAELDAARAASDQADAAVKEVEARIAKKHLAAPFSGALGLRLVSLGQYLAAGAQIVQLESLDPIYADFGLPQKELARVHTGMSALVSVDAYPDRTFEGVIEAINPRISTDTMNMKLRVRLDNREHLLRPGMFATIEVTLPEQIAVVAIPGAALSHSPYGDYVYLVQHTPEGAVVHQRFVKPGPARGDQVSVLQGLEPGSEVVSAGQMKLRNNIPVRINNTVQPDNNAEPKPAES